MTERQVRAQLIVETKGLACGRGETMLVRDLDLELSSGHGLLLRGPNGSGKSTLLLTLAGLLPPLAGKVHFSGHDPDNGPVLHYCGHRNGIRPRLSVSETLGFWAAINGAFGLSIAAALEKVGLAGTAKLDARWRGSSSRPVRSGCSTNPPQRSTSKAMRWSAHCCPTTSPGAGSPSSPPMTRLPWKASTR
jgi:energy-coupling factor transporter ATP-binding protein EcfA2